MKVFFAGAENKKWDQYLTSAEAENRFYSYYYGGSANNEALLLNKRNSNILIVDSGAHTFFSESDQSLTASVHKKQNKTKQTPDEYFEKYLEWLIKNKPNFSYFVELDIGELVGQQKVLKWRKQLEKHNLLDKCITVCHPAVTSYETYLKELDESVSRYVAIEGLRPGQPQIPYGNYVIEAYKKQVKIHGFALTNTKIVSKYPFYSVDSTSWLSASKFGQVFTFTNGRLSSTNMAQSRKLLQKTKVPAKYYDSNTSKLEISYELLSTNIKAFQQFENYYTKLWEKRGIKWT